MKESDDVYVLNVCSYAIESKVFKRVSKQRRSSRWQMASMVQVVILRFFQCASWRATEGGKEEVKAIFRVWVLKQVHFGTNGMAFTLWLIVIGKIGCHVQS